MSLNRQSDKARQVGDIRRDLLQRWVNDAMTASPHLPFAPCEIQFDRECTGRVEEGHEPLLRSRGGSIVNRSNVLLTCHHCHMAVHRAVGDDLKRAYANGYLVHTYDT